MPQPLVKICKTCAVEKPVLAFSDRRAVCRACYTASQAVYREKNRTHINHKQNVYDAAHREENREKQRARRAADPEHKQKLQRRYREAHQHTTEFRQRNVKNSAKWGKAHPERRVFYAQQRADRVKRATPSWSNLALVDEMYKCAKQLGWHVHHVVPIISETACGLHVPLNLHIVSPERHYEIHHGKRPS